MGFAVRSGDIPVQAREGQLGAAMVSPLTERGSGTSVGGKTKKVQTLTVASSVNGTARSIDITDADGNTLETINWTEGASDAASATALYNSLRASGVAGSVYTFAVNSAVVTATARIFGDDPGFANDPATVTVATTTAAASTGTIPFGRALIFATANAGSLTEFDSGVGLPGVAAVPTSSQLWDITYEASAVLEYALSFPALGETYVVQHVMATDLGTSVDALVDKINDIVPANRVVASNSSDDLLVEGEIAGLAFDGTLSIRVNTTGAVSLSSETQKGWRDMLLGIAERVDFTVGEEYAADAQVQYLRKTEGVWVDWDSTQTTSIYSAERVWVATDSGNEGRVYVEADGTNRFPVPLSALKFIRKSNTNASLALLRVAL